MISIITFLLLTRTESKPPKWHELSQSYTFQIYLKDFTNKCYNNQEYAKHHKIYNENLLKILEHNSRLDTTFKMGINHLTDLSEDEILQEHTGLAGLHSRKGLGGIVFDESSLPFEVSDVEDLPPEVDWRIEGVVTPVKDQGHCGSCWAFSTIATLESHIALQTGYLFTFSPQELVSCTPNPNHCGGNGGCSGSTTEIAFDYIANHGGIVLEDYMGYDSGRTGLDGVCSIQNKSSHDVIGGIASINNYTMLPSNNYTVLMNAIAKYGPVSVSVAANTWAGYETGILKYNDVPNNNTNKFIVNHAVNLVGYGTDVQTGMDYWLVRNSWSPLWGENGYIRLERVDPMTLPNPKAQCGMDNFTASGSACVDGNGTVTPSEIEVCGTSAILSESTIPIGGYLIQRDYGTSPNLELS